MDKQIEEMAKHICIGARKGCDGCGKIGDCSLRRTSERLYNAGYRKQSESDETSFQEDLAFFVGDCTNAQLKVLYETVGEKLKEKGYRKESDVAREIFEEIEETIVNQMHKCEVFRDKEDDISDKKYYEGGEWSLRQVSYWIAELKKKYESEGANDDL